MKKTLCAYGLVSVLMLAPFVASAAISDPPPVNPYAGAPASDYSPVVASQSSSQHDLSYLIDLIVGYMNEILFLLLGVAIVIFVWYVIQYFIKPNEDRKGAGMYVMYSLIGFFVILSFWGLVNILQNTFGLQNSTNRQSSWSSFTNIFPTQQ